MSVGRIRKSIEALYALDDRVYQRLMENRRVRVILLALLWAALIFVAVVACRMAATYGLDGSKGTFIIFLAMLGALVSLHVRKSLAQMRRNEWISEGRCPRCGYDLRESKRRCPECGRGLRGDRVEV